MHGHSVSNVIDSEHFNTLCDDFRSIDIKNFPNPLYNNNAFSALTLLVGQHEGHPACKNRVVGCWCGYQSGAKCRLAYGPADATATHSPASVKSRLVLPFWYRLTWVVSDEGPLNKCVYVCMINKTKT